MQTIGYVVSPGFQVMSFAALSVFEFANIAAGEAHYEIRVLSEYGGLVRSSMSTMVETEAFDDPAFDTVIVGGGPAVAPSSPGLLAFAQRALTSSRRLAAICTGAFVL